MVINFFAALAIEKAKNKRKRKALLAGTLFLDFGVLFLFKYSGFTIRNLNHLLMKYNDGNVLFPTVRLLLPLGISFYTFQLVSYVIDVYGKKVHAERNFWILGLICVCFRS